MQTKPRVARDALACTFLCLIKLLSLFAAHARRGRRNLSAAAARSV